MLYLQDAMSVLPAAEPGGPMFCPVSRPHVLPCLFVVSRLQKPLRCSVAHISFSAHADYDQTSGFLDEVCVRSMTDMPVQLFLSCTVFQGCGSDARFGMLFSAVVGTVGCSACFSARMVREPCASAAFNAS